jgi:Nucleotidyltransferase of unknown function (DUF6036)
VPLVDDLFRDLDARWGTSPPAKIRLRIIGSSALMLQTDYERGTKDSDVLETSDLTASVRKRMLDLAGEGTLLHQRHRLYIEFVASGIPFLPQVPLYHQLADLNAELHHFDLEVLDVVDVIVAKLKRFHGADRSDVDAMVKKGLVPHQRLVARFRDAVDSYAFDARAADLPNYVTNLHVVERDFLSVRETDIELPEWHDR